MAKYSSPINTASRIALFITFFAMGFGSVPQIMGTNAENNEKQYETLLGNYLSGRFASGQRDNEMAVKFYRKALEKDPSNELLLEQSFLLKVTIADWDKANELANELIKKDPDHYIARLYLGIVDFQKGNFKGAQEQFENSKKGPIAELTAEMALAWNALAQNDATKALELIKEKGRADWANFYRGYHRALIADISEKSEIATKEYNELFKKDTQSMRVIIAHVQRSLKLGNFKRAEEVLNIHLSKTQPHPLTDEILAKVKAKQKLDFMIKTPAEGLAEVMYGLGEALRNEGGLDLASLYLQLSLHLNPNQDLAHAALASIHETNKKFDMAIQSYSRIPESSPLWSRVKIREALNLNSLEKVDEAKALLDRMAVLHPEDIRPLDTMGNILRTRKRYQEALEYYDRAIKLIKTPTKDNWAQYYSRGVCYERLKQWDKAEADLKKALELEPNQPLTLNYLGYSWVDQNKNLKDAMGMIRKAIKLKPNDGYLIDSLGWAHYRLGNYEEAVKYLEDAVGLKAEDPVINDHLGDAYWKVGRKVEAKYQWSLALTLQPEEEEIPKIKLKLEKGLPEEEPKNAATLDKSSEEPVKK